MISYMTNLSSLVKGYQRQVVSHSQEMTSMKNEHDSGELKNENNPLQSADSSFFQCSTCRQDVSVLSFLHSYFSFVESKAPLTSFP